MPSMSAQFEPERFDAIYYDGKTAVRHVVQVVLSPNVLLITDAQEDEKVLATWSYADVTYADEHSGGVRVAKRGSEARLVIKDRAAYEVLLARVPHMMTAKRDSRRWMLKSIAITIAVLAGFYIATPYLTGAVVAMTPLSVEERMGAGFSQQIVDVFASKDDVCQHPEGIAALRTVVDTLSAHSDPIMTYRVEVLDVDMVNAMALPGGYMFVFRGLLDGAESPEELAGVLAHEMAHVDLRHPMQGMVRHYGTDMLTDMMFGGSTLGSMSGMLMDVSYTRDAEQDADERALETLQRAGISSKGLSDFFARLEQHEGKSMLNLPQFLSTHPDSGKRSLLARDASAKRRDVLTEAQWSALKGICGK